MARPTPIIIPGPSGMGSSSTQIDLSGIGDLIGALIKRRRDQQEKAETIEALQQFLPANVEQGVPVAEPVSDNPLAPLGEPQLQDVSTPATKEQASQVFKLLGAAGTEGQKVLGDLLRPQLGITDTSKTAIPSDEDDLFNAIVASEKSTKKRELTPQEIEQARIKAARIDRQGTRVKTIKDETSSTGFRFKDAFTGEDMGEAPATRTLDPGGAKEMEIFAQQVGESDKQIKTNMKSFGVIQSGLRQLESGIISGTLANAQLGFEKALSKAGLTNPVTNEKIASTEAFAGLMGIRVGQVISLFGAGTGLSDADREFATKIAAGDITLNEQSIRKLLTLNQQVLLEEAMIHNELLTEFNLARDDRGLPPSARKRVNIDKFLPKGNGKSLDRDSASLFKAAAKGDRVKAEELARSKGWVF